MTQKTFGQPAETLWYAAGQLLNWCLGGKMLSQENTGGGGDVVVLDMFEARWEKKS